MNIKITKSYITCASIIWAVGGLVSGVVLTTSSLIHALPLIVITIIMGFGTFVVVPWLEEAFEEA